MFKRSLFFSICFIYIVLLSLSNCLAEPAKGLNGFDIESVFTTDLMSTMTGGIDTGFEKPTNLDFILNVDTSVAGWWSNGTFSFYLLHNEGGNPSADTGDFQVTSNIEAVNTFKLYEAWYEHRFWDDRLSVLFGLHDLNSEFYALEYAGLFINSSFGIGAEVAQVGPSIFPVTALATRVAWYPGEHSYLMTAIYDGIPGDPNDPSGTQIRFDDGDGFFTVIESGFTSGDSVHTADFYKAAVGVWYHTADYMDFSNTSRADNAGFYFVGEKRLFSEGETIQGLGAFLQLGLTKSDRNQVDRYLGAGINYTGLIPGRDEDVFGLAIAHARNSDTFLEQSPSVKRSETTIEMTYQFRPAPWLSIQPDIQYIVSPGMDTSLDNALVATLRFQVNLAHIPVFPLF